MVPPVPIVGAAIAVGSLLLGLSAALVADSLDRTVRGPRHIRAAGGELVAVLPTDAHPDVATDLATAVLEARKERHVLKIGLTGAGDGVFGVGPWADALGVALADCDASTLVVDIASGSTIRDGLAEVSVGLRKLNEVARIADGLNLARVGPGRDRSRAVDGLAKLATALPKDLEVLVVALPPVTSRTVIEATTYLDHVLVVAERGRTTRVELLSALTAIERVRQAAQVILLDGTIAHALGLDARPDVDDETEATRSLRRTRRDEFGVDEDAFTGRIPRVAVADEPGEQSYRPSEEPVRGDDSTGSPGTVSPERSTDAATAPRNPEHPDERAYREPRGHAETPHRPISRGRVPASSGGPSSAPPTFASPPAVSATEPPIVGGRPDLQPSRATAGVAVGTAARPVLDDWLDESIELAPAAARRQSTPRMAAAGPASVSAQSATSVQHDTAAVSHRPVETVAPPALGDEVEDDFGDEDLLRTTAQLAMLMGEMQDRERGE